MSIATRGSAFTSRYPSVPLAVVHRLDLASPVRPVRVVNALNTPFTPMPICTVCRTRFVPMNSAAPLCARCAWRPTPQPSVQCSECGLGVPADKLALGECAHCGPCIDLLYHDDASVAAFWAPR
jgi:hypothetical protein